MWLIELAMALAAGGLVDQAVAVGDALADQLSAERSFRDAITVARSQGDVDGIADANERLAALFADQPGREPEAAAAERQPVPRVSKRPEFRSS